MAPDQIKKVISIEYKRLLKSSVNRSAIYSIIESRAREGAAHGGIPDYWREYLPKALKAALEGE